MANAEDASRLAHAMCAQTEHPDTTLALFDAIDNYVALGMRKLVAGDFPGDCVWVNGEVLGHALSAGALGHSDVNEFVAWCLVLRKPVGAFLVADPNRAPGLDAEEVDRHLAALDSPLRRADAMPPAPPSRPPVCLLLKELADALQHGQPRGWSPEDWEYALDLATAAADSSVPLDFACAEDVNSAVRGYEQAGAEAACDAARALGPILGRLMDKTGETNALSGAALDEDQDDTNEDMEYDMDVDDEDLELEAELEAAVAEPDQEPQEEPQEEPEEELEEEPEEEPDQEPAEEPEESPRQKRRRTDGAGNACGGEFAAWKVQADKSFTDDPRAAEKVACYACKSRFASAAYCCPGTCGGFASGAPKSGRCAQCAERSGEERFCPACHDRHLMFPALIPLAGFHAVDDDGEPRQDATKVVQACLVVCIKQLPGDRPDSTPLATYFLRNADKRVVRVKPVPSPQVKNSQKSSRYPDRFLVSHNWTKTLQWKSDPGFIFCSSLLVSSKSVPMIAVALHVKLNGSNGTHNGKPADQPIVYKKNYVALLGKTHCKVAYMYALDLPAS